MVRNYVAQSSYIRTEMLNVLMYSLPMSPDHFEIAVSRMKLKNETIQACRKVLVEQQKVTHVAAAMGLGQGMLSGACRSIKTKWVEICDDEGLECREVALPRDVMEMLLGVEKYVLSTWLANYKQRRRRKKPTY